ncbi:RNA polymerase sigma factor [Mangrovimonas sp. TPBH4]|uniref:RNA polymerase sigma factor n=1 Tax=Mangrovimonas sp. TPBH4 TaxID=1645914 RepID=UPI0006B4CAF2|nr:sigma-70 family RNA polymerase sigma factor [Mangrovimonas sp. TPBH4]
MTTDCSDKSLWSQLKEGSTLALGTLYDRYVDELYLYGCKISSKDAVVKDSIHDLFLDLYKYRKNLSETDSVKFYLLRALKNKILKNPEFKKSQSQEVYTLNKDYGRQKEQSIEDLVILDEISKENSSKLMQALNLLPKRQKQGVILKFIQNKNYEEIADIMNVNVETSRTIIYRGLKSLRKAFLLLCVLLMIS